MKIAYICHPVAGDVSGNIQKILKIVRDINLSKPDVVPFVPYMADLLAMDDNKAAERERSIDNGKAILASGMVNELWVYGRRISAGMEAEIGIAAENCIPVIVMDPELCWPYWLPYIASAGYEITK
jgi:hypothetical protein